MSMLFLTRFLKLIGVFLLCGVGMGRLLGVDLEEIHLPDGFLVELAAGPPLVTHPTMACFDEQGRLYVCNNAGVNMTNEELDEHLPNAIYRLEDRDGDGRFDFSTVFADKMTFPMGGAWYDGALYVASPPNIWRLRDNDGDGVADEREVIVSEFGYTGNAASIHGCFFGPDGRLYWTDGYHGHQFRNDQGQVISQREGAYIFSCRPDGSDVQMFCGGGMDNPVEVDFTEGGDMLGTVNIFYTRPRVDCLVHWQYGGAYPHRQRVLQELKTTGELLTPAHRLGHVAVSGMTRYRSGHIDSGWRDDLFTTFFNSGKVVRLSPEVTGSTYRFTQHEFLSTSNREFHPTDVLEDADGSLLVIDTGGWFYRGCPTSQFSKPELLGGIYRIRRTDSPPVVDPRGLSMDWKRKTPEELIRFFDDPRFAVRERAITEIAGRGNLAIPALEIAVIDKSASSLKRLNSVWALTRLAGQSEWVHSAALALLPALSDSVATIRQAACRAFSTTRAEVGMHWLMSCLDDEDASVRRQAAASLGVIGKTLKDTSLVEPLLGALNRAGIDRLEEHSILYALIELADAQAVRRVRAASLDGLNAQAMQRAALIILDQLDGVELEWHEVLPSLEVTDAAHRRIASEIVRQRLQWANQIGQLLEQWLETEAIVSRAETVESLMAAHIAQERVARVAGRMLSDEFPPEVQTVALRAIGQGHAAKLHASWLEPLQQLLRGSDETLAGLAIAAVGSMPDTAIRQTLTEIEQDETRSSTLRVEALGVFTRSAKVDDASLQRLISIYRDSKSVVASRKASQILAESRLSSAQLVSLAPLLKQASPADLRNLVACFQGTGDPSAVTAFLSSLEHASSFLTLAEHEFSDVIKRFPVETLAHANRLHDQLKQHRQQQLLQVERLNDKAQEGDAVRGRAVFFSDKAKCSSCHRIGNEGLRVGPDLTTIGMNRSTSDLLESIVFPSASIVRDYETYRILTVDGRILTGLISSESIDTLEMQIASGEKIVLRRSEIEELNQSNLSIMPAGLEQALTEQELLDVIAYLYQLGR